jgi:ABC-type multidrug transport system fused ATPase/permease subunit
MTTIRKADIIYCLDKGTISSQWTHAELLKKENIYKDFWEKQVVS